MAAKKVPIIFTFEALDRLSAPLRQINKQLEQVQAPVKRFRNEMSRFGRASGFTQFSGAIKNVAGGVIGLGNELFMLGLKFTAAGAAAYYGFQKIIGSSIHANGSLAETAQKTGISVEALQKWRFVAEQTGGSAEALDESFVKFSKSVADARRGTGDLVSLLGKDSAFLQQLTQVKDTNKAYDMFIRQLGLVENAEDRVRLGAAGLGRGSSDLINMTYLSEEARQALFKQKEEIGLLSKEQAEAFDKIDDKQKVIVARMEYLRSSIVAKLLPTLQKLAERFDDWLKKSQPLLDRWAITFADKLPSAIEGVISAVKTIWVAAQPFLKLIGWIAEKSDRVQTVMVIWATYMAGPLLGAIATLSLALVELGLAFLATPIGWFVLAFGVIAGISYEIWKHWDAITTAIRNAVSAVGEFLFKITPLRAARGGAPDAGLGSRASYVPMGPSVTDASVVPRSPMEERETKLKVMFENVPKGVRVEKDGPSGSPVDLFMGLAFSRE